ncbi:MAG TPA: cytochrome c biogenesis protein CcdA [Candidatus Saccharimonadales bacterium]|nr:cytochrome c biogenesis protein CcdA [Candidatus Saccharimonadales bacterium]
MVLSAPGPSIPLAFLAGLVSFLSPCVFPLMPAYAAYLSGRAGQPALATAGADGTVVSEARRSSVMSTGFAFVLGFSVIFIAEYYLLEGVLAITVFQRNLDLVNRIAGAIIMVLALQTMGVLRFGWLARERRFHVPVSSGATGGLLLGLTFAAGWLPCLGPQLGAILTIAQNREFGGLPFMVLYCLGLAVPFLLVAVLADRLQGVFRSVNRHLRIISIVAGAILFGFGLLMATGQLTVLSSLSFQSPFNL